MADTAAEPARCNACGHKAHGTDTCHEVHAGPNELEVAFCECVGRTAADVFAQAAAEQRARAEALSLEVATLRALATLQDAPPLGDMVEPGRAAFDAYRNARGGKNHDGSPTPTWEQLNDGVRAGWIVASIAAVAQLVPSHAANEARLDAVCVALGLPKGSEVVEAVQAVVRERGELKTSLAGWADFEAKAVAHRDNLLARIGQLEHDLDVERATPPESKLAAERRKREHFRCAWACARRWYMSGGGKGSAMGAMPEADELFAMYPDLAPAKG